MLADRKTIKHSTYVGGVGDVSDVGVATVSRRKSARKTRLDRAVEPAPKTVAEVLNHSQITSVMDELDLSLVGLVPIKQRVRDIAASLVIDRLRRGMDLPTERLSLHMCFSGNPGTGKTTVAMRMAELLHRLGYVRKGQVVAVTRDDLVGQYVGHTAPKTREVIQSAMGGVLFIDEAYYLYRAGNERDYGQESIEILLQAMENNRDDLVVILAGYKDRMDDFFQSNPGMRSRIAHHLDFPDYSIAELMQISVRMLTQQGYHLGAGADEVLQSYLGQRIEQPNFSNARSVRNALERARLKQATRLFSEPDRVLTKHDLSTIEIADFDTDPELSELT